MKVALMLVMLPLVSSAADAQSACAPHAALTEMLAAAHGEALRGYGVNARGELIETWASEATGTWTVLRTRPGEALTCMIDSGASWAVVLPGIPA